MEIRLDGKYKSNIYGPVRQVLTVSRGNKRYPVVVEFLDGGIRTYTKEGVGLGDKLTEFFEFKKGDPVLVRNSSDWTRQYFSHIQGGLYHCFSEGGTEWSSSGRTDGWKQCCKPALLVRSMIYE